MEEEKTNECCICTEVIKTGDEYYECTSTTPENLKNPHKVCNSCYAGLMKGYDVEDVFDNHEALEPAPRLNEDGTPMLDVNGQPIMMSREQLIEFYRLRKHASFGDGCPMHDNGGLEKKIMGPPANFKVVCGAAAAAAPVSCFARGGHDNFDDEQIRLGLEASLKSSGPGAAACQLDDDPELAAALLASTRETETPIQKIRRRLLESGIVVSEDEVRHQYLPLSRQYSDDEAIRQTVDILKWPRHQRVMTQVIGELINRKIPIDDHLIDRLRISVRNILKLEPNEVRAADSVVQLFTQIPRGGKKSKIMKSRRGKKSKVMKSRRDKKSKIMKSRRYKRSKMTRKKV
jgi:hypothetical protein